VLRLIVDRDQTVILGPAGFEPPSSSGEVLLWRYRVAERREERIHIPGRGFSAYPAADWIHLMVKQKLEDGSYLFTIRPITDVESVLATGIHTGRTWTSDGPSELWDLVPRYVLAWSEEARRTVMLHLDQHDPELDPLDWHNRESYDLDYQGLVGVYPIPGSDLLIISVQRDSSPVLYDPRQRQVVRRIRLSDGHGNPSLYFRHLADELWADDYDTLLRLRSGSWEVLDSLQLQGPGDGFVQRFIGEFWFPPEEDFCLVARPFSGDVVLIDPVRFEVIKSIPIESQPIVAVKLRDGRVIARDWQTRRLLEAHDE
jgi:hypothetical protein